MHCAKIEANHRPQRIGWLRVQRKDVQGNDGQRPDRVGGDEEHLIDGVEPDHGHGEPAEQLAGRQHPHRRDKLQGTEDGGDPAPGGQVGEHEVRVIMEHLGASRRGDALDQALRSNLTIVSVYGGDDKTVGSFTLDPTTHSVLKREMGVFEYKGGKVTAKAFFGIGGEGYVKA